MFRLTPVRDPTTTGYTTSPRRRNSDSAWSRRDSWSLSEAKSPSVNNKMTRSFRSSACQFSSPLSNRSWLSSDWYTCSKAVATSESHGNASPDRCSGGAICPTCSTNRSAFDERWTWRSAVVPKTKRATRSPGVRISCVYKVSASRTAISSRDGPRSRTHIEADASTATATSTSPRLKLAPP